MSCICLHSEGQATFSSATHGEMRVHGLSKRLWAPVISQQFSQLASLVESDYVMGEC